MKFIDVDATKQMVRLLKERDCRESLFIAGNHMLSPGSSRRIAAMSQTEHEQSETEFDPRHRRLMVVALAILGAVLWWSLTDDEPMADDETGPVEVVEEPEGVSGKVVDQAGRPVVEAEVRVDETTVAVDEGGRFSIGDLAPGTHLVDANAEGHVRPGIGDEALAVVVLEEGESVDDLELVLRQPASISGRITAGGTPVDGADIALSYRHAEGLHDEVLSPYTDAGVAESLADGTFEIPEVAPGRLTVLVEADEGVAESDELYVRPNSYHDDVTVDVAPSGQLSGVVVGEDGEPVEATVGYAPSYAEHASTQIETGDGGEFSVGQLQQGRYVVEVVAEGYRREIIDDVIVDSEHPTELAIDMERSRGIVGRVVEPDGTLVEGASVTIERDGEAHRTETDDEGRFEWEEITAGRWKAVANSQHHDPSVPTPIEPGAEIAVELNPGGMIMGRILDDRRRPITEYTIGVSFLEIHGQDRHHTRELPPVDIDDRRGRLEVGPVPSGRVQLVIDAADGPGTVSGAIEVEAGETTGPVTIETDAPATLTGVVRDLDNGEPLEGARVVHEDPTSENPVAESDVDGRYRLDDLPPGARKLRVEHDEYATQILDAVELPEGETLDYDIDLTASAGGSSAVARYDTGAIFGTSDDAVEVAAIPPGSPAARSGLEEGDMVTAVDRVPTDDMSVDEVLRRIRGDSDEPAVLQIERVGRGTMQFDVERRLEFVSN